ncbi:hypothetical protein Hypma_011883 [Hypsizygus marmoreus]|uniref:Small ribosomal subunit protein mS38 n=1 Tax=Hypsizygus marmoreus TaxID=39966 RepID=A0A369JG75_HYPMA|nr:hypothetical protein Hypma_011883 [Hypsizygus marmoreus]
MSAFARFLHPPPAARRAYSSFFSSKSGGGGRYFNSSKPPKVVVSNGAAKNNTASKVDSSAESQADGAQTQTGAGTVTNGSKPILNTGAEQSQSGKTPSSSSSSPASAATNGSATGASNGGPQYLGPTAEQFFFNRQHPVVNAKDFKLHQFFSLHRPLLLLSHPTSILDSAPQGIADLTDVNQTAASNANANAPWLLDEYPEASMDADAAAARQLTRALTINHAGASVAWEATLRKLGIDVDKESDRVNLQQQWDREWQEVMMDSVKRKRRKKMKKHKLKKRRKATRASRLKIGR